MNSILLFLHDLSKNNNREWFEKNKERYLSAKAAFDSFLLELHPNLVQLDNRLATLDPKKSAFRIHRDVRFSKDKNPYKLNFGAAFSPSGKMMQEPGYYVHIQPQHTFIAGGMYMPDATNLSKIRQEIDYNSTEFNNILSDKLFKKQFPNGLDTSNRLKNAPKGYPKDHPHVEWLKYKSYTVSHPFSDSEVTDKTFMKRIISVCTAVKPLNTFLTQAIVCAS